MRPKPAEEKMSAGMNRREFLQVAAGATAAGIMKRSPSSRGGETLDEALDLLKDTGFEYGGGLANHGPMAAEALCALGRFDSVLSWVEGYKRRLRERPDSRDPVTARNWREALGDPRRLEDWASFFERQLERPWREVVNEWVPRLAPGLVAAAAHGIIRTGHAVRALAASETPLRKQELARGLAYWAGRYQVLPEGPRREERHLKPSDAIELVQLLPQEKRQEGGMITGRIERLADLPSFASVIHWIDPSRDPAGLLSDLTETCARVFLASAPRQLIALIHGVTGTGAIRLLLPHVSREAGESLLRYGWQMGAALYAACGQWASLSSTEPPRGSAEDLVDRAVATGDEHAIKLTETCLREHALHPGSDYLVAIDTAVRYLA